MKKPKLKQLWPAVAFAIILILGISLRITLLETRDYWYDEAFTGVTIRQDWSKMNEIIINDVHPPLYYWILKLWSLVLGSSPIALRLFSVIFGVGTVVLSFIAARLWLKEKSYLPALLVMLVFALNPFLSNYSQEARMYTFLGFLILLASVLLRKKIKTDKTGYAVAYSIVVTMILFTHYVGLFYVLALFLYDAWQHWIKSPGWEQFKQHVSWLSLDYGITIVAGLAWIPFFLKQISVHSSLGWVPDSPLAGFALSFHKFLFGSPVGVPGVPPALGYRVEWLSVENISFIIIVSLTVLITWLTVKKKWDKILVFLAFMAFFPLILTWLLQAVKLQLYVERFLSGSAIFLLLFLMFAINKLTQKGCFKSLTAITGIYVFLIVLIQPWTYNESFPQIADQAKQVIPTKTVVFTSPFDFTVARFYLGESLINYIKLYNINNINEDLSSWAIIDKGHQIFQLPSQKHLLITPQPGNFPSYQEIGNINNFAVLNQ